MREGTGGTREEGGEMNVAEIGKENGKTINPGAVACGREYC